ncbi:hypothetical protein ZWY2020_050457 [Hordeum vulgare]|nr:hypothetical protein ZWY2020_050457 [Hordeum vulgare]
MCSGSSCPTVTQKIRLVAAVKPVAHRGCGVGAMTGVSRCYAGEPLLRWWRCSEASSTAIGVLRWRCGGSRCLGGAPLRGGGAAVKHASAIEGLRWSTAATASALQ